MDPVKNTPGKATLNDIETIYWEPSRYFLGIAIGGLLAGSVGFFLVVLWLAPDQKMRLFGPVLLFLLAAAAWFPFARNDFRTSVRLLVYGSWLVVTGMAIFNGGVRAPIVYVYPLLIVVAGWQLGARAAVVLAGLTMASTFGFSLAETAGLLPAPAATHAALHWVVQAFMFVLSVLVITYLALGYQNRIEEVRRLGADLARLNAEAAVADQLRRSSELLDRTGSMARVGGWELDLASGALTWTTEVFRIHDMDPVAQPDTDQAIACYAPEVRPVIEAAVRAATEQGRAYDLELPLVTARGRAIWVRTIGEPQFVDGKVVRLSGTFQDISEQRRAAQALKTSVDNLQRTLEAIGEGIFAYDGRDPSGRLLFANDEFFRIWNIAPEDAPNTGRAEIIAAARKLFIDPDAEVRRIGEILGQPFPHEDRVRLRDGRVLLRRSAPIAGSDGVSRIWSFRDITREEQAVQALLAARDDADRAKKEAESANAAKSEFLANMSHEIRTPLNAVLGLAQVGRRETDGRKVQRLFQQMLESGEHLLGIINNILDFSKIEAGKLTIEAEAVGLPRLAERAIGLCTGRAAAKGLALRTEFAAGLPEAIEADPLRLSQVLANLLDNAVKFTDRGEVALTVDVDAGMLRFRVRDSGIGMGPEQVSRLFGAFEQADGSTTRRFGGTGLGLAISRRLVELMGGAIRVESVPGAGSLFEFTLPLIVADAGKVAGATDLADGPGAAPDGPRLAGMRILVAEDNPVNQAVLMELLGHQGARIVCADDGLQALERIASAGEAAFDIVLSDVQMPNIDGHELARRLRETHPSLPVVGVTAHAFAEDRRRCLDSGMVAHVTKPVDVDGLVKVLLAHARKPAPGSVAPDELLAIATAVPPAPSSSGAPAARCNAPVDWEAVLALYQGREAFVAKLVGVALDSQGDSALKLRAAASAGDFGAIAFIAHSIKGMSANFGAGQLSEFAGRTDAAARVRDAGSLTQARQLAGLMDDFIADLAARRQEVGNAAGAAS